jgi:predicted O-methyltransferase YrrM
LRDKISFFKRAARFAKNRIVDESGQDSDYGLFFASILNMIEAKTCVEIGVQTGKTTELMCEAMSDGHVYGFDNWGEHGLINQFKTQPYSMKDVEDRLHKAELNNFTLTKVDTINDRPNFENKLDKLLGGNKIDFAFIDADHSYIGVKNDFEVIYPRLKNSGIIAFHDTLMIDGCREFMLDLRTKYFDGTYDVIDMPFGKLGLAKQLGISLLVKRSFPVIDNAIFEICGSKSSPDEIEMNESQWLKDEINKNKNHDLLNKKISIDDMDKALYSENLKPTDRTRKFVKDNTKK